MKKGLFAWLIFGWVLVITLSLTVNYNSIVSSNNKKLLDSSRDLFGQIVTMREWNSMHGGVYVPITKETQPNPYLVDSLRDISTAGGLKLTKINPAYMTRQLSELNKKNFGLKFHITSLKPIRPANYPDYWETEALISFEKGSVEAYDVKPIDSVLYFRYMSPLITEQSCLKCHAVQGYKLGEIRGGISVSTNYLPFLQSLKGQLTSITLSHLLVLFLGVFALIVFYRKTNYYFQSLNDKNNELKNLNYTKDKMYSIIAHDLKNPFNSIVGMSNFLIENIDNLEAKELDESLKSINISAKNTKYLLDNLLEWTRAQTGMIKFNPERININQMIGDVITIFNSSARVKNIEISNRTDSGVEVFADKNMLLTIIRNLISNSLKFTNPGGIINISTEVSGKYAVISVIDNGVGIEKEILEQLFSLDINHTTTGTMSEKGSGLGLVLTMEFLKINNGTISVQSEKGAGSTFKFTLPLYT